MQPSALVIELGFIKVLHNVAHADLAQQLLRNWDNQLHLTTNEGPSHQHVLYIQDNDEADRAAVETHHHDQDQAKHPNAQRKQC